MNYNEWKDALKEWSHRPDLSDATITIFEKLVRARLGRELKLKENSESSNQSITANGYTLPGYVKEIKHVQRQSDKLSYTFVTPEQINFNGDSKHYTIEAGVLFLDKAADVTLYYYRDPEEIAATDTNDVITQWPNIYLYAGLVEVARYVQDEGLLNYFNEQYIVEVTRANRQAARERIGNAPAMRAI